MRGVRENGNHACNAHGWELLERSYHCMCGRARRCRKLRKFSEGTQDGREEEASAGLLASKKQTGINEGLFTLNV